MFVFVSEQRAALLEDLRAQITGVDAVFKPPLLGVIWILKGGNAIRSAL